MSTAKARGWLLCTIAIPLCGGSCVGAQSAASRRLLTAKVLINGGSQPVIWPFSKTTGNSHSRLAVQVGGDQLYTAVATAQGFAADESLPMVQGQVDTRRLKAFVESNHLEDMPASILIGLADYQMLLVEAPPVEPSELAEALKWKVKDLLNQPVEQSVVDGFLLPEDAFRGRQKMAYAVATRRDQLQQLIDCLENAGLRVDNIAIPELALLPLFASLDEHPALLVVLGEGAGFISMVADKQVYLIRKLDAGAAELQAEGTRVQVLDRLVLEIQRSRDYFESQMGKGVINRILLLPTSADVSELQDALGGQLNLPVETLAFNASYQAQSTEQFLLGALLSAA